MPNYDTRCLECGILGEDYIRLSEIEGWTRVCPTCSGEVERLTVPLSAPALHIDGNNYGAQISKMKRSFNERFVKSGEIDDVRHKHGVAFDDSLRGAAVEKIKNGVNPNS